MCGRLDLYPVQNEVTHWVNPGCVSSDKLIQLVDLILVVSFYRLVARVLPTV